MSSHKGSWSQEVFDWSGSQRALIRASDRKTCIALSETEWALIRAPDLQNVCWSIRDSMFVDRGDNALSETEWALIRAPDRKKFASQSEIQCLSIGVTMSSNKSSWSQGVCCLMRESMSSHKSSWSEKRVFAGSGSQWALIRASDCKKFFGQSESQWRAPDRKKVNEIQIITQSRECHRKLGLILIYLPLHLPSLRSKSWPALLWP